MHPASQKRKVIYHYHHNHSEM